MTKVVKNYIKKMYLILKYHKPYKILPHDRENLIASIMRHRGGLLTVDKRLSLKSIEFTEDEVREEIDSLEKDRYARDDTV